MLSELRNRLFERIDERPNSRSVLVLLDAHHPVGPSSQLHHTQLTKRAPLPELIAIPRDDFLSDVDLHPQLLVLRTPADRGYRDDALLDLTLACAMQRRVSINGAYVCGWLVTDAPLDIIAKQLQRNLVVRNGLTNRQGVLPLFEPHRMVLATHLAPQHWLSAWLGDISSWFLIDACGQIQEVRPSIRDATQLVKAPDIAFWQAQNRVPRAREALLAMVKSEQMIPIDCEIKLDQALQVAYRQGLDDVEDVIFFTANHMILAPHWFQHPVIHECIEQARSEKARLTDSMSVLPDSVLDELSPVLSADPLAPQIRGNI